MRFFLVFSIIGAMGLVGCTRSMNPHDAGSGSDMGADDAGGCTSDARCNDSIACTLDQCVAGNVCTHTPLDGMCDGGRCSLTTGCTASAGCTTNADCDDHVYCNGVETCVPTLHQCLPGTRVNCDDGNPCTTDTCVEATMSCAYVMICDSGVVTTDSGPTCTAFAPPADFNGVFAVFPGQSQACGGANYDVSQVTLSVSGSTVTAVTGTSGAITMTGTITGASFSVTGTRGGGTYSLTGSFTCRERFMGHWTANVSGFGCVSQDADVQGIRR